MNGAPLRGERYGFVIEVSGDLLKDALSTPPRAKLKDIKRLFSKAKRRFMRSGIHKLEKLKEVPNEQRTSA